MEHELQHDAGCPFRLFVYGTLKPGAANHDSICRAATSVAPGLVRGRLVERPEGYPTLFVPPHTILAYAGPDYREDALCCEADLPNPPFPSHSATGQPDTAFLHPTGPWTLVHGQILQFPAAAPYLAALDAFEEYFPDGPSMYLRVLLPVWSQSRLRPCWAYISPHSARFAREFTS